MTSDDDPRHRTRDQTRATPAWQRWFSVLPVVLVLAHAALFRRYIIDDAYITYTSAKNWARGFGPVFVPGERVEATSSLLWTLLLTPFEAAGLGAPFGSKVLGALCAAATLIAAERLRSVTLPAVCFMTRLCQALLIATSSTFVLWTSYGMENGLMALLLLISLERFGAELKEGKGTRSALVIFLLEATRPEGFIFVGMFVVLRILYAPLAGYTQRRFVRNWLLWLVTLVSLYELAGYLYFGELFPNPVAAKVTGSALLRAKDGVRYLLSGHSAIVSYTFFAACCVALPALFARTPNYSLHAVLRAWREHPSYLNTLCLITLQLAFTVLVGGDWMPNGRFVSHIAPLVIVSLVTGYGLLSAQLDRAHQELPGLPRLLQSFAVCLVVALIGFELHDSPRRVHGSIATLQDRCDRALVETVAFLNRRAQPTDVVACADVGYVGYFFRGRVYDWWGIATAEVTALGQALGQINPATVLKHQPRFIVLYATEPSLTQASAQSDMAVYSSVFLRSADFMQHYHQVHSVEFTPTRYHVTFERGF